ncbi:phage BR0599 family protein, partial [Cribrihabitans sp. XS_ASV171]
FDLSQPGYVAELAVETVEERAILRWAALEGFDPGWFQRGRLEVLDGAAAGLWSLIKRDAIEEGVRLIELWEPIRASLAQGDRVRLVAGCDKRMETCRLKFDNLLNFQGFPDLPGEDWMVAVPKKTGANTGGSRR